jgi:hypothetical protein
MMATTKENGAATAAIERARDEAAEASRALAFNMALEPNTIDAAYKLAATIAKTRICGIATAEDALVRLLTGRELGLPAMVSLRQIYTIEGKPSLEASLMLAICLHHPMCEYFEPVTTDAKHATYKAKRRGREEIRLTWTIEMAAQAKLLDRGENKGMNNWNRYPDAMLRARCTAALARIVFPDAIAGLYAREEFDDGEVPAPPQTVDVTVAQAPPRDFDAELHALKLAIRSMKSKEDAAAIRAKFDDADWPQSHRAEARAAYNAEAKARKDAAQAPTTPAPPDSEPRTDGGR